MKTWKRLLLAAATLGAIAALATFGTGATFGLFNAAQPSGTNTFNAGSISVGLDSAGTQVTCATTGLVPGDASDGLGIGGTRQHCEFDVVYTGSVNGILGLDVGIAGPASTNDPAFQQALSQCTTQACITAVEAQFHAGQPELYDGSVNGLQFIVADGTHTYFDKTSYQSQTSGAAPLGDNSTALNLLVSPNAAPGATVHFSINYFLPRSAGSQYENGYAAMTLNFHAVQAESNTVPGTCTIGAQCKAVSGTFDWS